MHSFFYGWYFKCQSDTQTLAVIPAIHGTGRRKDCSIQIISDDGTWTASFPADAFCRAGKRIAIGRNRFGERGIRLAIHTPELRVSGMLDFGRPSPLRYDIMGPFALVPFLECRHSVFSMLHAVYGRVNINGREYAFQNALVLLWQGREYRLATYLGTKAVRIRGGKICVVQGDMELEARLLRAAGKPLRAPANGDMIRTIHESAACRAGYRFRKGDRIILDVESDRASFEYEYPI